MLDVIDNTYNLKNKMTIINYLDYILNKNMNYTDIIKDNIRVNNFYYIDNKELADFKLTCNHKVEIPVNKNNIRRCGVIFIKDFVNTDDIPLHNGNTPPPKTRKILFVKGKTGYYSFPKGRMQEGETNYKCASREVYEETGINISESFLKILPVLKMDNNIYFICNLNNLVFIDGKLNFIIEQLGKKYAFNHNISQYINFWNFNDKTKMDDFEIEEACWHTLDEIMILKPNKDIRNVLKKLKRKVEDFSNPFERESSSLESVSSSF